MTFEAILQHLRAGKYVWRTGWRETWSKYQQHLWYERELNNKPTLCSLFEYHLKAEDIEAIDWEIYERSK